MKPEAVIEKRKDKIPYEYYKEEFKALSTEFILGNSAVLFDETENVFKVNLLGDIHTVSYPSGEVDEGNPNIKYSLKTLILRYLLSGKDIEGTGKMINYRDVQDGNLYYHNFYGRCLLRLAKTFKNKFDLLAIALEKLDAECLDLGDLSYRVMFLPNMYLDIIMYAEDEEFSASAQILFSDNVPFYFSAEDLAFVGDTINDKLVKLAYAK
jgi:hypothetical protein